MVIIGVITGIALGVITGGGGVGDIVAIDIGFGIVDLDTLIDIGLGTGIGAGELEFTLIVVGIGLGLIGIMFIGQLSAIGVGDGPIIQSFII